MDTITIPVNYQILRKFQSAAPAERERWEQSFNLWWLLFFEEDPKKRLALTVKYMREKASERGLTPKF